MARLIVDLDADLFARTQSTASSMGLSVEQFVVHTMEERVIGQVAEPKSERSAAVAELEAFFARADARNVGSDGTGYSREEAYGGRY